MKETLIGFLSVALVFIVVSIPLVLRRVPPNSWYGLRVSATFADEAVWYEANAASGRDLIVLGVILALLALILPLFSLSETWYVLICTVVMVIGVLVLTIHGWRRANRLLRERKEKHT